MKRPSGFTVLELLGELLLSSVLFVVGFPAYQSLLRTNRMVAMTNEFVSMLHFTRMEAVTRGRKVTLCKSADGQHCAAAGGFEQGWLIFEDADGNARHEPSEAILRQVRLPDYDMELKGNVTVSDAITYSPAGAAVRTSGAFQAGTLELCLAPEARRIIISRGGRIRVEPGSC